MLEIATAWQRYFESGAQHVTLGTFCPAVGVTVKMFPALSTSKPLCLW